MQRVLEAQGYPGQINFDETCKDITVYPSMVRLTHIYTLVQANKALQLAFRAGMELHWTADGINEFDIAVNTKSRGMWITIVHHLSENLCKNRRHLNMLN